MEKEDLYEVNKNDNTKRLMLSAICVLMLLVIALCVYLLLFYILSYHQVYILQIYTLLD